MSEDVIRNIRISVSTETSKSQGKGHQLRHYISEENGSGGGMD